MLEEGYTIRVDSWEFSKRNNNREILSGLTEEDVKFYIFFLKPFSKDYVNNRLEENFNLCGNAYNKLSDLIKHYKKAHELYPNTSDKILKYDGEFPTFEECEQFDSYHIENKKQYEDVVNNYDSNLYRFSYCLMDFIENILGVCESDGCFVRVCEDIKVFHVEKPPVDKTEFFI